MHPAPTLALLALLAATALSGCAGQGGDGTPAAGPGGSTGTGTWTGAPPTGSPSGSPTTGSGTGSGTVGPVPPVFQLFEDFEAGLGNWTADRDVPQDPNRPGQEVAWNVTRGDNGWEDHVHVVPHPTHGARFRLDGRQDDGTVWLERTIDLAPGRAYRVNVTYQAWSASESFNLVAYTVAYAGPADPEREADFPAPGENLAWGLREPLNQQEGWRRYGFEGTTPVLADGRLHVAVGISAVWETEVQYDLDAVKVTARAV